MLSIEFENKATKIIHYCEYAIEKKNCLFWYTKPERFGSGKIIEYQSLKWICFKINNSNKNLVSTSYD